MTNADRPIWLDLTQRQLDDAYDQSIYSPNRQQILSRFHSNSERTRRRVGKPQIFSYGSGSNETLQVFSPPQDNAPINIFIHGGAWRSGSGDQYAFLAELFLGAGAHLVLPEFDWVQDRNGDLLSIADQVCRAIAWVGHNASRFSGNPEQIYLSGHSSGAHLSGAALTTDWQPHGALPSDLIKGALLCSGMYDLTPVALSARSSYVNFTPQCIEALSALRHIDRIVTPLIIAYGDLETPEFQRQSNAMFDAVARCDLESELIVAPYCNHFEVLESMANPYGLLGEAVLRQMGLPCSGGE